MTRNNQSTIYEVDVIIATPRSQSRVVFYRQGHRRAYQNVTFHALALLANIIRRRVYDHQGYTNVYEDGWTWCDL